jgi:DNA excision repair protein ERCC-2
MKKTDAEKLQNEYQKLVEGLREADQAREEDSFMANPGTTSFTKHLTYSLAR